MHNESGKWELNEVDVIFFFFVTLEFVFFYHSLLFFLPRNFSYLIFFRSNPLYRLKFINKFAHRFNLFLEFLEKKLSIAINQLIENLLSMIFDITASRSRSRRNGTIHESIYEFPRLQPSIVHQSNDIDLHPRNCF